MAQLTVERALKLQSKAWSRKQNWHSLNSEAFDYTMPDRNTHDQRAPGQQVHTDVWDGTAPAAVVAGANRMMEFVPQFVDWIVLEPGPAAKFMMSDDQYQALQVELAGMSKMCNAVVSSGGFHTSAHEAFMDWLVSTGGIIANDNVADPAGHIMQFASMPLSSFMVDEGPDGSITRQYRWHEMVLEDIATYWPDAKLPDQMQQRVKDKPDEKVKLVEIEYLDRDNGAKKWRYEVFICAGKKEEKTRIVERASEARAMIIFRNAKTAGEELGRGPVITSLPDIRTVNKIVELTFRAAAMNLLGIWTAVQTDELNTSALKMVPGAVIGVPRNGGANGPSIQRLDSGNVNVQLAELLTDDMRMNIKKALLDSRLPSDAGPVRSATEIAARIRDLAADLGGTYGRLMHEFVVPLVQRIISVLYNRGMINGNLQIDQFFVNVTVSSPLAREQSMSDLNDVVQWLTILRDLGGRELMMVGAMVEDLGEYLADLLGIEKTLVRPRKGPMGRDEMQKNMGLMLASGMQPGAASGAEPQAPAV